MSNSRTFPTTVETFSAAFDHDNATLHANKPGTLQEIHSTMHYLTYDLRQSEIFNNQLNETITTGTTTLTRVGKERHELQDMVDDLMAQLPPPDNEDEFHDHHPATTKQSTARRV